jgi:manganese oxidase
LINSHTFTDQDILTASTYVYTIRAVDKYGNESMSSKEILMDLSGQKTKTIQTKEVVQAGQSERMEMNEFSEDVEVSAEEHLRISQSFQLTKIEFTKIGTELPGFVKPVEERDKVM